MQSFLEISKNRYTTKHYDQDKKISQKDIDTLLEIARLTPSAVNIQPWHFYVGSTDEYDALTEQEDKDGRFGDPKLKEAIGSHRMEFGQMHEKLGDFSQWTAKQVYLVMAALLYGAASMGIDSTPIEGMDFAKADEILRLKDTNLQSVGIVTLGYRKDDSNALRPKSRLAKETIISSLD